MTVVGDPCGSPVDGGYYGPEQTPNDDRDHATRLTVGVGYGACVQMPTDVDWYDVVLPSTGQGGYLTIALSAVGQGTVLKDDLYAAATNGLIHTTVGSNPGSSLYTWIAAVAGTPLRVAVYGEFNDARATGPYTITASFQAAVEASEPNNDRAHATPISLATATQGVFFRGFIDDMMISDPADYYKVTLPAAGMMTATLTNISATLRGNLALYDSAGGLLTTVGSANDTAGADAQLTYSASAAGTYYVTVTERNLGDVPLAGDGRNLPDVASHPYTLTVTSP